MEQLLGGKLTCCLIVVDADPVQLQVTVSVVCASGINAVLVADHFPELRTQNGSHHIMVTFRGKKETYYMHVVSEAGRFKWVKQQ